MTSMFARIIRFLLDAFGIKGSRLIMQFELYNFLYKHKRKNSFVVGCTKNIDWRFQAIASL